MDTPFGTLGFSWIGALYLVALFAPNILWARKKPQGYDELAAREPRALVAIERAGEVAVSLGALVFAQTNPHSPVDEWWGWLIVSVSCMFLYEAAWRNYFASGCELEEMYAPLLGIPVPLASLPVTAFALLGIYGRAWPLVVAAVILGIGHIGIHLLHWRELVEKAG